MALVVSVLQNDLLSVFLAMNNIYENGDRYMADNVAAKIKSYILTGNTQTTDTGTATAGAYTGKGSGKMTIDNSSLANDLYSTFVNLKDNDDYTNRVLFIGDCPRCGKHVCILSQRNKKTNGLLTINKLIITENATRKEI